jgi:hypothetical protein
MRVNSTNVLDEGTRIGGRAMTRDSGIEIGTRRTQVHVPAVEDRYMVPPYAGLYLSNLYLI